MKRRAFFKMGLLGAGTATLCNQAWALKFYPMPSDKKWAIVYCTWCGSTRDAALWISEGMSGIAEVFDFRENPDLSKFDHLVIGGAIRSGTTSKAFQDYLHSLSETDKKKVRGYFAVCGNMRKPVGSEHIKKFIGDHLARICKVDNLPSHVFLGRITKSLMDPQTAERMKTMEDYDNLKRPECMEFGKEILAGAAQRG